MVLYLINYLVVFAKNGHKAEIIGLPHSPFVTINRTELRVYVYFLQFWKLNFTKLKLSYNFMNYTVVMRLKLEKYNIMHIKTIRLF